MNFYQIKQAYLSLKQKPGFVFSVVTTMGVTLGALLCVLTLAYVMLVKPLPYPEQDKLYLLEHVISDKKGDINQAAYTYPGLMDLYKNQDVFSESALSYQGQEIATSLSSQPKLTTLFITPTWFNLFDVPMRIGRYFDETEGVNSHKPVAVLSYQTWQEQFSKDANVLGKKIVLDGISFTIVGVVAQHFVEPTLDTQGLSSHVYLSWDYNLVHPVTRKSWENIDEHLMFIGKLTKELSIEQINQTLTTMVNSQWQEKVAGESFFDGWHIEMRTRTLQNVIVGASTRTLNLLIIGVLGLLLIASANIVNLFIARAVEQQHSFAIFAAFGATTKKLFNRLFIEAALLMIVAMFFALLIAFMGFTILQHYFYSELPRVDELSINAFTLILAFCLTLLLSFIFAKLSHYVLCYKDLKQLLHTSGKGVGIQISSRIRKFLVFLQIVIVSCMVFINLNLFIQAEKIIQQPSGFNTNNIVTLRLSSSYFNKLPFDARQQVMLDVKSALTQLPEIETISQSMSPFDDFGPWGLSIVGEKSHHTPDGIAVDENYFQMIEQNLVEGDYFTKENRANNSNAVIVNDVLAKVLAPNGSVIGKKVDTGDGLPLAIVGVVKGVVLPNTSTISSRIYIASSLAGSQLLVKLKKGQHLTRNQVVEVLKNTDGQFNLFAQQLLTERSKQLLSNQYVTIVMSIVLVILTLFLSALGLYGILSYATQMRRFEIGTRMAIGAKGSDLIKLIIKDNANAILIGIVTSVVIILALSLVFSEQLQAYLSWQLLPVFLTTLALISAISFIACYLPLRQYINKPAVYSLRGSE